VFTTISEVPAAPNFRAVSSETLVMTYAAVHYYNAENVLPFFVAHLIFVI
jgi:hypothetical protein